MTTDIIVGFPGETEDDFDETLAVVAEAGYDSAYTFIFSPRPGTRAAAMEDRFVPAEVVAERFERLRAVVERSALRRHQARVGRTEEVLVEGPEPAGPDRADRPDRPGQARALRPARRRRPGDRVVRRGRGDRRGAAPPDRAARSA